MLSAVNISSSALVAERARMDAISSNLANISTTHNEKGEPVPYQPKFVILQTDPTIGSNGAAGVKATAKIDSHVEPLLKYEPGHPDADKDGFVAYPNVSMMEQFTDAMVAARTYEANLGVMQIAKDMELQSLKIIA
ncbi:MAG: flagellar basal body rod protein FlgC [Pirellulales bacterium]|nr:flagellar basal body rod protein FlgC [Pirellulales bacterium]